MKKANPNPKKERMIHIRLPEDVHKRLRVHVAEIDMTMQSWVVRMVERELNQSKGHNKQNG
jgi:predicted HicB family RNase H-like nuclease